MSKKLLVLLLITCAPLCAKSNKCKTFRNLVVCNALTAGTLTVGTLNVTNNETVGGSVTASSFITPAGPLFPGLRNYAVLTNTAAVTSGSNVLWSATPASNLSSGITNTGGSITLPTTGIFLVQYTVRFTVTPFTGTETATAQLQQTVAGTPTNISQAAITNNVATDGISDAVPSSQRIVTGSAIITTTSSANNTLNLLITFDGNDSLPIAIAPDANAQMIILQLN